MNVEGAHVLMRDGGVVNICRNQAEWTGTVVGIVTEPSLILQDASGHRMVLALDGARATVNATSREERST